MVQSKLPIRKGWLSTELFFSVSLPLLWVPNNVKIGQHRKCAIESVHIVSESTIASSDGTVRTCNKSKVGKHRIIPYCKSFP